MLSEPSSQSFEGSRCRPEDLYSSLVLLLHRLDQSLGGFEGPSFIFIFTQQPSELSMRRVFQQFPDGVFLGQKLIEILSRSAAQSVVLRLPGLEHHPAWLIASTGSSCHLAEQLGGSLGRAEVR